MAASDHGHGPGSISFGLLGALSGVVGAGLGGLVIIAAPLALAFMVGVFTGPLSAEDLLAFPAMLLLGLVLGVLVGGIPAAVVGAILGVWLRDRPIERRQWIIIGLSGLAVTAAVIAVSIDRSSGIDLALILTFAPVGLVATVAAAVVYRQFSGRFGQPTTKRRIGWRPTSRLTTTLGPINGSWQGGQEPIMVVGVPTQAQAVDVGDVLSGLGKADATPSIKPLTGFSHPKVSSGAERVSHPVLGL